MSVIFPLFLLLLPCMERTIHFVFNGANNVSMQLPIQSHSRGIFPECLYTQAVYWERIRRNLFRATALPTFSTSATYFRKHSAQFLLLNFRLGSLPPYGSPLAVPLAASRTFWQVASNRDASTDFDQLCSRARARPLPYGHQGSGIIVLQESRD